MEVKTWKYKMPFGKYKGKTLEEIYKRDKSYLAWMYSKEVLKFSPELAKETSKIKLESLYPSKWEFPHWADDMGYYIG
ncbi:MAG TPA: DUF3820 family protein [Tissierellaceae bacterium]|nr:DUF3820 family protein [Tissierellaceae bacterium]